MRIRRLATLDVAVTATVLAVTTAANAGADSGNSRSWPPCDSLRALAAPIGLRIGTALTPFELNNSAYRQITLDQFSTVTPGNEMKWQIVEPTQGTYDWSGGDRLVTFAQQHDRLVSGHSLLWHNQLPNRLTSG